MRHNTVRLGAGSEPVIFSKIDTYSTSIPQSHPIFNVVVDDEV